MVWPIILSPQPKRQRRRLGCAVPRMTIKQVHGPTGDMGSAAADTMMGQGLMMPPNDANAAVVAADYSTIT